jgi:hypothetical protein
MEGEVSTHMGADEEPWDQASFLSMVDELCRRKGSRVTLNVNLREPLTPLVEFPSSTTTGSKQFHQSTVAPSLSLCKEASRLPGAVSKVLTVGGYDKVNGLQGKRENETGLNTICNAQTLENKGGGLLGKRGFPKCILWAWKPKRTK